MVPDPDQRTDGDETRAAPVAVDRGLAVPVDAAAGRSDTAEKPDRKSGRALEWAKAIGMPLATVAITLVGGYYFTSLTKERETREINLAREREARASNERLYAQLLTQREQSDALIRKDMFGVVINRFFTEVEQADWDAKVLQLELLANNFNQSLDLAPLFKDLARKLARTTDVTRAQREHLAKRLDLTAANVIFKQVNTLKRRGLVVDRQVPLASWQASFGKPFIDVAVPKGQLVFSTSYAPGEEDEQIHFSVEIVDVSIERREVEIRLRVDFSNARDQDVDRHFWVGQYDFPMLDNTQLPHGLRTSVVITEYFVPAAEEERAANSFVKFHLVVFPAASASFKERQDYDDILMDMLRAGDRPFLREGEPP